MVKFFVNCYLFLLVVVVKCKVYLFVFNCCVLLLIVKLKLLFGVIDMFFLVVVNNFLDELVLVM